jgi:hypothetical protein
MAFTTALEKGAVEVRELVMDERRRAEENMWE